VSKEQSGSARVVAGGDLPADLIDEFLEALLTDGAGSGAVTVRW